MSAFECFLTIFAVVSFSQFLRGVVWVVYYIQGRDLQEKETAAVVFCKRRLHFYNERNILPYIST